jgi:hypothetical protein
MASDLQPKWLVDWMVPIWLASVFCVGLLTIEANPDLENLFLIFFILFTIPIAYFWHKWSEELRMDKFASEKNKKEKIRAEMAELEKFEMQNTCKRCGKIWFLGANELAGIEAQLRDHEGTGKTLGLLTGLNLFTSLTSPGTGNFAQHSTTTAIGVSTNVAKVDRIKDEFDEKARCPDCKSTDSERELVEKGKGVKKSAIPKKKNSKTPTKNSKKEEMRELKEMFDEGLIDEDEFKEQKNKILNS